MRHRDDNILLGIYGSREGRAGPDFGVKMARFEGRHIVCAHASHRPIGRYTVDGSRHIRVDKGIVVIRLNLRQY